MTINCPACEGEIEVGDELLGEGLACPHCDHPFLLTEDGDVAEYEAEDAATGGPSASGRKGIIVGAVVGVCVLAVGGFFLFSGSSDGPSAKPAAAAPAKAPARSTAAAPGADADAGAPPPATMPGDPPDGMPAAVAEPVEALSPVEIPDSPDGAIVAVTKALAEGNPRGIWDALPASYQTDVNSLIRDYAETTDPVMWDKGFGVAARIAGVLRDKKDFIFNSPMMAMNPQKDEAAKNWDAVVGVLNTVLESDLAKREKLMALDVGRFLGSTGAELFADFESLAKLAPSNQWAEGVAKLNGVTAKVLNTTDGIAEVEVSSPGETNKVEKFVQIENRWIPQGMALDWENMMTSARTNLAGMKEQQQQVNMQTMMIMGMVEGVLAQFENAKSQAEFNMAAQGIFGMLAGGMGGGGMPGAAPGGMPSGFAPPTGAQPEDLKR